jgi:ATP/maltotriose-dependent transcriptional regulator MalT
MVAMIGSTPYARGGFMVAQGLMADRDDQQARPMIWLSRVPALYMPRQLIIRLMPAPAEAIAGTAEASALDLEPFIAQLTYHRHSGRLHPKVLCLADYEAQTLRPAPALPSINQRDHADQRMVSARRAAVEPLTAREHDILRAAATGLSNSEIAAQHRITTGTVKWHLNNIYGKLGVRRRTQAIASARELGYLPG